nr:hypothetical protein Hi04_10k_c4246_00030 [uncultured bacterium]
MNSVDRRPRPAATMPSAEEKHLLDYVRVIYKRRWIALPVFLIVMTFGVINTLRQTSVYQGRVQLLIEKDTPNVATLDQMFQSQDGWFLDDFYQTQYRILQSRSLARRSVDLLGLWDAPRLGNGPDLRGGFSLLGLVQSGVSKVYGLVKSASSGSQKPASAEPPAQAAAVDGETAVQSARIDEFLAGLTVAPVKNSRLVELRYQSTDPVFAASAANAVAKSYIQQSMDFRTTTSKAAADFLGDRLGEQRKAVEKSEAALQAFRERNGAVSVADNSSSNIVMARLTDLNAALTKAKTERINKEALYNQLKSAEKSGAVDALPAVLSNDYIQRLKGELADLQRQRAQLAERYGERHAEMIKMRTAIETADAKLRNEMGKIVESVANQYQAALSEERGLQSALDAQKGEALGLNRKGIEFSVLQREVESNRQIYQSLLQRTKETDISSERRSTNVRIIDAAETPRVPILPHTERDLMITTFGALLLALGLVFVVDYMDNRIKTPQELKTHLPVPFLGMLPTLAQSKEGVNPLISNDDVPANFMEAFKKVRTNMLFSSADDGLHSVVVTSAAPGEGKSLVASNLAVALAQTGQRVLLMDADMRRPRVHEIFDAPMEPGLSNLMTGNVKASEAIRKAPSVPGLWLLPSGHIPPNPAELLGSRRYSMFVASLAEHFDWLIIDSPPVMVVADGSIVANLATGVLFVVGADRTTRQAVRAAYDQLVSANARVIGSVLNRVDIERHSYYYASYYRKEYARYYVASQSRS